MDVILAFGMVLSVMCRAVAAFANGIDCRRETEMEAITCAFLTCQYPLLSTNELTVPLTRMISPTVMRLLMENALIYFMIYPHHYSYVQTVQRLRPGPQSLVRSIALSMVSRFGYVINDTRDSLK